MAYTRLNLKDGDTLTAEHIKHLEEGIENATPEEGVDYLIEEKDPTVNGKIEVHNFSANAHDDIRQLIATTTEELNYFKKAAVTYFYQSGSWTEQQKAQARANIGAVSEIYMVTIFEELKAALEKSDIEGAVAVLDEAILNLLTLA